ncbi:methyltransferase [Nocardioides bruguierae]|uniref:Methyltransferase n=1 Tax=Nocardioides bruguierae TaxID=2945102 RepID=A0A9X2IGZ1_9ACTN|nr:methyltransferase [Nocardioides bruguierae]MCM0622523.1 hypothetical protein [Nocardioides bruguierae]
MSESNSSDAAAAAAGRVSAGLHGFMMTQILATSVEVGVIDAISGGSCSISELSASTGISEKMMRRFLPALQGLEVVRVEGQRVALTELGATLRSDVGTLAGLARLLGNEHYAAWAKLGTSLRTGESGFRVALERDPWSVLDASPDQVDSLSRLSRRSTDFFFDEITHLIDLPARSRIADIGCGDGSFLAKLVAQHAELRGIAFDQMSLLPIIRRTVHEYGVEAACAVRGGSFFEPLSISADVFILKSVLHDWDDESAVTILHRVRESMGGASRLVVIEFSGEHKDDLLGAAMRDLNMLVLFGGADRSATEYTDLLVTAGFKVVREARGSSGILVVEAEVATLP